MNPLGIRSLPVRQYAIPVRDTMTDERAVAAWPRYARIREWSPVGTAYVQRDPHSGERWLLGKLVEHPGLIINGDPYAINIADEPGEPAWAR